MNRKLSPLQEKVVNYYTSHPRCSRLDCCQAVYGSSDPFMMINFNSVECEIRKKGYLFYSANSQVINMESDDAPLELKVKIQRRAGKIMVGYFKSNIRLIRVAKDQEVLATSKEAFKESLDELVKEGFIQIGEVNQLKLTEKVENPRQLTLPI